MDVWFWREVKALIRSGRRAEAIDKIMRYYDVARDVAESYADQIQTDDSWKGG